MTNNTLRSQLGRNVERLRLAAGLTKTKLGLMIGLSRQYIERVENGTANITINVLDRIARGLGVDAADLLDVPDEPPAKRAVRPYGSGAEDGEPGVGAGRSG